MSRIIKVIVALFGGLRGWSPDPRPADPPAPDARDSRQQRHDQTCMVTLTLQRPGFWLRHLLVFPERVGYPHDPKPPARPVATPPTTNRGDA
jgi:hypothetical protein